MPYVSHHSHRDPEQFTAPAHWASFLINGDDSGLSPSDLADAEACVRHLCHLYGSAHVCDCSEPEFRWRAGDYGNKAGDYCTYTLLP